MASLRAILFTTQNPIKLLKPLNSINPLLESHFISSIFPPRFNLSPISQRPFSNLAEFEPRITSELEKIVKCSVETIKKKPFDVFFREAVGVVETTENSEEDFECKNGKNGEMMIERLKMENGEVKEKGEKENKEGENLRKLDPDMIMFVTYLYKKGYFQDSIFLPRNMFDVACLENSYAHEVVAFAAEQFGKDNQEIAKWLSVSKLKEVAVFGCPSLARKNVTSAKRLRTFFRIKENTVCDRCVLKKSCELVNQSVSNEDTNGLNLSDIMRVLTLYALESVPSELVVPEEIKGSVGKLLKEAVKLSGPFVQIHRALRPSHPIDGFLRDEDCMTIQ